MKNYKTYMLLCTVLFSLSFLGCKNNEKEISAESTTDENIKEELSLLIKGLNTMVDDPENEGEKMLLGLVNQDGFKSKIHFPWMYEEFENYKPSPSKVQ